MMANIHYIRTTKLERREKIISLWTSGSKQAQITGEAGLSPQTVSNFLNRFHQRRIYLESRVGRNEQFLPMTLLNLWNTLNLLSLAEIRQALVGNGICAAANAPSRSTISDILRKDQNFSSKILSVCPEELLSGSSTKKLANLSSKY